MGRFGRLRVVAGADEGRAIDLESPGGFLLGRQEDAWFRFLDPTVSRQQATVVCDRDGVRLVPLSERNPPLVNDEPLRGARALREGDRIQFGDVRLLYEAVVAPDDTIPAGRPFAGPGPAPAVRAGAGRGRAPKAWIAAGIAGAAALVAFLVVRGGGREGATEPPAAKVVAPAASPAVSPAPPPPSASPPAPVPSAAPAPPPSAPAPAPGGGDVPEVAAGSSTESDPLPSEDFLKEASWEPFFEEPGGLKLERSLFTLQGRRLPPYLCHLFGKPFPASETETGRTPDLLLLRADNRRGKAPATLLLEIEVVPVSDRAVRTVTVPAGEERWYSLSPIFRDSLFESAEQRRGAIRIRVVGRGRKVLGEATDPVTILGRNDFVVQDASGRPWFGALATFVTPRDRGGRVAALLRRAVDHCPFKAMLGYQEVEGASREDVVLTQLRAVYDALAADGLRYVNTPFSSDLGAGTTQSIKFPAEVVQGRSGNCIEETLLFASALEAMEMNPVIVVIPGHAFVGVERWARDPAATTLAAKDFLFLEATMCGTAPFAAAVREGGRKMAEALKEKNLRAFLYLPQLRRLGFLPAPL